MPMIFCKINSRKQLRQRKSAKDDSADYGNSFVYANFTTHFCPVFAKMTFAWLLNLDFFRTTDA
jgi:hypothetical protein